MRELTPDECKAHLEQAESTPMLLDVREPWEYQIVHLENSQLVPMRKVPEIVETLNPHQEIIVVCHHGIRSRQVALFLEHHGFSNVVNLRGGLDAWARHTDTSLPTY
jgi:rhodanese-related sulfurtransferase